MDFDEEDISNGSKNNRNNNSLPPFRNVISRKRTIMNVDDSDEEARIVKSNKRKMLHSHKNKSNNTGVIDDELKFDNDDDNIHEPATNDRYEVEAVHSKKLIDGKEMYLIQWKGYTKATWEPVENLDGCKEALKRFHKLAKDTDIDFSSKIGKGRKQRPRSDELQNRLKTCYADGRRTDLDLYQKIWIKRNYPGKNERTEPRIET
ncbi:2894_t:CDS:2, partial [Entrophospora sp. SA101]